MKKFSKQQSGFTLMEVLVAMLIFSIGIAGIAALQGSVLKTNYRAANLTRATFNVSNVIESILKLPFDDPSLIDLAAAGAAASIVHPSNDNADFDQDGLTDASDTDGDDSFPNYVVTWTVVDQSANRKLIRIDIENEIDTSQSVSIETIKLRF